MRRRIWSETVPYDRLASREVVELLRRHDVAPIVAVRPGNARALAEVIARHRDAGAEVAIWPMLSDADGRWVSAKNEVRFRAFVNEVLDELTRAGALPSEVAVDLEPPIEDVKNI